jgi:hypothetical protein
MRQPSIYWFVPRIDILNCSQRQQEKAPEGHAPHAVVDEVAADTATDAETEADGAGRVGDGNRGTAASVRLCEQGHGRLLDWYYLSSLLYDLLVCASVALDGFGYVSHCFFCLV